MGLQRSPQEAPRMLLRNEEGEKDEGEEKDNEAAGEDGRGPAKNERDTPDPHFGRLLGWLGDLLGRLGPLLSASCALGAILGVSWAVLDGDTTDRSCPTGSSSDGAGNSSDP